MFWTHETNPEIMKNSTPMGNSSVQYKSQTRRITIQIGRSSLRHIRQLWAAIRESRIRWPVFLALLYAGVILPIICHSLTLKESPDAATWQSGSLHHKLSFVLSARVGFPCYPFMVYPIICLILVLFRERQFATHPVVRFGIFSGAPVAAWYCVILAIVVADVEKLPWSLRLFHVLLIGAASVAVPTLIWGAIWILLWLRRRLSIPRLLIVGTGTIVLVAGGITAVLDGADLLEMIAEATVVTFFFSLIFAPFWALGVYAGMTLRLAWKFPQPRFRLTQLLAGFTWLSAFLSACRWVVLRSLEEYSKLPTEPPGGCYVATAAAHGHPSLVGSHEVTSADGRCIRINQQLATFKVGELALRAWTPGGHRFARYFYDAIGPPIARHIRSPWLADVAYVSLKPAEWTVRLALRTVLSAQKKEEERLDKLFFPFGD